MLVKRRNRKDFAFFVVFYDKMGTHQCKTDEIWPLKMECTVAQDFIPRNPRTYFC